MEYLACFSHGMPVTRMRLSEWALPRISYVARRSLHAASRGNNTNGRQRARSPRDSPKEDTMAIIRQTATQPSHRRATAQAHHPRHRAGPSALPEPAVRASPCRDCVADGKSPRRGSWQNLRGNRERPCRVERQASTTRAPSAPYSTPRIRRTLLVWRACGAESVPVKNFELPEVAAASSALGDASRAS